MALDLNDYTSNNNNLTNNGVSEETTIVPASLSGATNSAKFEDANTDYLRITAANTTNIDSITATYTLEWWMYINSLDSNSQWIIANDDTDRGFLVYLEGNLDTLRVLTYDSSGNRDDHRYNTALSSGAWHHYAITCDVNNASSTTHEFFVDGSSVGNGTAIKEDNISAIDNGSPSLSIGERGLQGDFTFDGYLKDVRVWNDVRTSTEISNNYESFLVGNEAGLVAYYPFENPSPEPDYKINIAGYTGVRVF